MTMPVSFSVIFTINYRDGLCTYTTKAELFLGFWGYGGREVGWLPIWACEW